MFTHSTVLHPYGKIERIIYSVLNFYYNNIRRTFFKVIRVEDGRILSLCPPKGKQKEYFINNWIEAGHIDIYGLFISRNFSSASRLLSNASLIISNYGADLRIYKCRAKNIRANHECPIAPKGTLVADSIELIERII